LRVVALEIEALAQQFGLEIAAGGIEPRILLSAIDTLSKQQPAGGVRDIARTIEKQITDGLIDAKSRKSKTHSTAGRWRAHQSGARE
jgi:hypothetical protein